MHRSLSRALSAAVLVAVAASVPLAAAIGGSDMINDLRFAVGLSPGYDFKGPTDTDTSPRFGVEYFRTLVDSTRDGGWIAGGEFSLNPSDKHGLHVLTGALTAFAGWGQRLPDNDHLHFEATPFFGLGMTTVDNGGSNDSKIYTEFGLRGAAFWTFDNLWQIGADLRFLSGQSLDNDWNNRGIVLSAVVGKRF